MKKSPSLMNVVVLAVLSGVLVGTWLVLTQDALAYYTAPLAARGYTKQHRVLRPSAPVGHMLGIVGTIFLFLTLPYVARKRVKRLSKAGRTSTWLEAHIFCGVFGPILVTFHTSLKFNGIVSVAYWSMVLVVASGFVGRYLYVRIPKSIRGEELSRAELDARASEIRDLIGKTTLPRAFVAELEAEEERILAAARAQRSVWSRLADAWTARRCAARLRHEIRASGLDQHLVHEVLDLASERALLLRRIARLERTRRLFQLWHVFHRPFVWVMFLIFLVHLGVTLYLGYTPFGG